MESFFILYLLRAFEDEIAGKGTGTTFNAITGGQLKEFAIPLPPLPEQHRIVTKVEELFTQLDAGVGALTKAKAQLKRYRQSVLKSACEGRLVPTEAELARAEGRDYEPADVLLARIGKERREKWDAENKRRGKKNAKYKEPAAPGVSGLPGLPEGWRWVSLDQLIIHILAGKSFKCEERPPDRNEIGVVKVSAVTWGEFNESESKTCKNSEMVRDDFLIEEGDFLFSRANTIELVGACVIVKQISKMLMLSDKILRFGFAVILPKWVLVNLRTVFGRSEIERLATGNQDSMRNIGQDRIRQIRIPLPPLREQHCIVAEIERRLSVADETEKTIDQSLKQAERLRQSILKSAFEGKLVSQDPNDEPAEKLLERIKQGKTKIKVRK
jgi:type I restriction enzyme S subunit